MKRRSQLVKAWLYILWSSVSVLMVTSTFGRTPSLPAVERHFAVGQEWSLKSAAGAPAKIVIGMIETVRGKTVVHVAIIDIPVQPGQARLSTIAHVPFDESALRASVDLLVGVHVPLPKAFASGYEEWKEHHGGSYSVPVGEVIRLARQELQESAGQL
jgi:hypothetical protein